MRKFILTLLTLLVAAFSYSTASAQTAYGKAKLLDNIYVGVHGTAYTQLTFEDHGPFINEGFGVKVGKLWTPVFATNIEGTAFLNDGLFKDTGAAVKAFYVGGNANFNLTTLFCGYNPDKVFEINTETGLGWLRSNSAPEDCEDFIAAKTGLIFSWNLGSKKAWQLYLEPAVYWALTATGGHSWEFNVNNAIATLSVGLVYKFKNSHGGRGFKVYDIGAYEQRLKDNAELIDRLNAQNAALKELSAKEIVKTVTEVKEMDNMIAVTFEQNSAVLSDAAKIILDRIDKGSTVEVVGSTSPEGTEARNATLSVERANAVAAYLIDRGVKVTSAKGNEAGRLAVVTVQK